MRVTIGGVPAEVRFAGLAPCCASIYQFNVVVPPLPDGNHFITIERMNVSSQPELLLGVANE